MHVRNVAIADLHRLMLEALRQREQDIFKYIAILGTALGGFFLLIRSVNNNQPPSDNPLEELHFVIGTIGVLSLLAVGALYSASLGYNFRYITFQLAKIESRLKMDTYILEAWPRSVECFRKRYGIFCKPPEIISIFWGSFIFAIFGVIVISCVLYPTELSRGAIISSGAWAIGLGIMAPLHYAKKIRNLCNREKAKW